MRFLMLSYHYHPDLSAGSFRVAALVKALRAQAPAGLHIDLVTTLPNRYSSYAAQSSEWESAPGLDIRRIKVTEHASDMFRQVRAFSVYAGQAAAFAKPHQYDLVFATSSRLMTAALGAWIAQRAGAPLFLDIRDIFVDTIEDVLPPVLAPLVAKVFAPLERWTMMRAQRINLVSRGFAGYFNDRYPRARLSWFTNGIDEEFVTASALVDTGRRPSLPLRVLYAGNIGDGQGLHVIVPELACRMEGKIEFRIIGDGGRRAQLAACLQAARAGNVTLQPPVGRERLVEEYRAADILFLHLNDYSAFRKVLPSKIFEYAAMGKPIWAGVAGFAAEFLASEVSNASIFRPCDADDALCALERLELADIRREVFVRKFSRASIAEQLAREILGAARDAGSVDRSTG